MKEMKKKFKYPFGREKLAELEARLERAVRDLSLALDGLGLNALSSIDGKVTAATRSLDSLNSKSDTIRSSQDMTHERLDQVDTTLRNLGSMSEMLQSAQGVTNEHLGEVRSTLDSLPGTFMASTVKVSDELSMVHRDVQTSHSQTIDRLGALKSGQHRQTDQLAEMHNMLKFLVSTAQSTPRTVSEIETNMIGMAVSKPALLKDMLTAVGNTVIADRRDITSSALESNSDAAMTPSPYASRGLCDCHLRRRTRRRSTRWQNFTLFSESVYEFQHRPGCPVGELLRPKTQHEYGIAFTHVRALLSTAVSVSLFLGNGRISPTIRCTAMVNNTRAPAFLLANMLFDGFSCLCPQGNAAQEFFLQHGISKLRQIFLRRAGQVTDVDQHGRTLLGSVLYASADRACNNVGLLSIIERVLQLGVPFESGLSRSIPITNGYGSIADMIAEGCSYEQVEPQPVVIDIVSRVIAPLASRDLTQSGREPWFTTTRGIMLGKLWYSVDTICEVLDVDSPILDALLRQRETDLESALEKVGSVCVPPEKLRNGSTAFDIAAYWPAGLRLLIHYTNLEALNSYSASYRKSPIYAAMEYSMFTCRHPKICHGCPCAESFRMLLDARCTIQQDLVYYILHESSPSTCSIRVFFLQHIKEWRERLKSLALDQHFPELKQNLWGLRSSRVLDAHAHEVVADLKARGVNPYKHFGLQEGDFRLGTIHGGVYHHLHYDGPSWADLALEMGFRDIDTPSMEEETPIMGVVEWMNLDYGRELEYLIWLGDHAYCSRPIPRQLVLRFFLNNGPECREMEVLRLFEPTIVHMIAHASVNLLWDTSGDLVHLLRILEHPEYWVHDGCQCVCSPDLDGCLPLTIFFNRYLLLGTPFVGYAYIVGELLKLFGPSTLSTDVTFMMIRAFTFHRLGIRHTCCVSWNIDYCSRDEVYGDDFDELRSEDAFLYEKMEELLPEFYDEFLLSGESVGGFIAGYWNDRMERVEAELNSDQLTEEEIAGMQASGVILGENTTEEVVVKNKVLSAYSLEFWINQIDSIRV
ncbi:hypothetical protein F4780DRAFT_394028 [Xylariomycetidae sp. FL0641]|nr:hypothetical protein F4780DRAFT_394028 [Xylariomycetidae sp. FL0641]